MIGLADITGAQQIIAGRVHRTPLLSSTTLGKRTNTHLYFKAEVFQKTGSFKPRGAINKLHNLTEEERKRGVIGLSSGNHAQGLAYAASLTREDHQISQVYVFDVAGGEAQNLTIPDFHGHVNWVGWKDNKTVMYRSGEGVWPTLSRVNVEGGEREIVLNGEGVKNHFW